MSIAAVAICQASNEMFPYALPAVLLFDDAAISNEKYSKYCFASILYEGAT